MPVAAVENDSVPSLWACFNFGGPGDTACAAMETPLLQPAIPEATTSVLIATSAILAWSRPPATPWVGGTLRFYKCLLWPQTLSFRAAPPRECFSVGTSEQCTCSREASTKPGGQRLQAVDVDRDAVWVSHDTCSVRCAEELLHRRTTDAML